MKLRVPHEILRQILQDMVDILPLNEVIRARRVNSLFDEELTTMLIDDEIPGCSACGNSRFREWRRLPHFLKVGCLWRKMEMHAQAPSILSMWVEDMLDLEEESGTITTKEQRDAVQEKLLHGAATGGFDPHQLLCPGPGVTDCFEYYHWQLQNQNRITWEPLNKTFQLLMLCSAIRRGDAAELNELLLKGWDPAHQSTRFDRVPLDVAAKKGTGDIIRVLLKRTGSMSLSYHYGYNTPNVWMVAARSGNKEALDALIEDAKASNNGQIGKGLDGCVRAIARIGKLHMMQYFLGKCTRDLEWLRQRALAEAICYGELPIIEWLIQQGTGVEDLELSNREDYKGPLFEALTYNRGKAADVVKLLLDWGVDPNKTYPTLHRTPLQTALFEGDMESAMILLQHGADLTTASLPAGSAGKRMAQPLFWAHKEGQAAMLHAMLDKGVSRNLCHKGKRYTITREREDINRVERIFRDLGWDETEIKAADVNYLIIQTG